MRIGLIGLGAIGTPIAHKLFKKYGDDFCLIASADIKQLLLSKPICVMFLRLAVLILNDQQPRKLK